MDPEVGAEVREVPRWTGDITVEELRFIAQQCASQEKGNHFCLWCYISETSAGPSRILFSRPSLQVKRHSKHIHQDIVNHRGSVFCQICGNVFRNRNDLDHHHETLHSPRDDRVDPIFYALSVDATLDGFTILQPRGGCNSPNFTYDFQVQCIKCGEMATDLSNMLLNKVITFSSGSGSIHLSHECQRFFTKGFIEMVPGYGEPLL